MSKLFRSFASITLILAVAAGYANGVRATSEVMREAEATAKAENKKVLVIFHASWCGWCKKMEGMLDDKVVGKLIKDNYVITFLTVLENGPKKADENPGGMDFMTQLGGADAGLPFYAILDENGKKQADSMIPVKGKPANIGYPAEPQEIAHFMEMLKTAPRLTAEQNAQIQAWLVEHKPKSG